MGPFLLVTLYVAVMLLPLALAWSGARPARSVWDELATGAGMLAFAIILAEFVLSGRFRAVSKKIGMDVTMRFHQLVARSALGLALIHPFLYASDFSRAQPGDPTRALTVTYDLASLSTGILGWLLLPAFVLISIGRDKLDYTYETWRMMHGLGAVLIAALLMHHTLSAGRYSADPLIAGVWWCLFAIAVSSLLFVYVVRPMWQTRRPWTVAAIRPVASRTWEVEIEPDGHEGIRYEAGQFAWLNIGNSPFSLHENPFSISSAPASGKSLQFVIKELGDFTRTLGRIPVGTRAYIDAPHGNLIVMGQPGKKIALIAGGVGIAPLLSILRELRLSGDGRPTLLIYGNRQADQIVAREELDAMTLECGTRVVHVVGEPEPDWTGATGIIDRALLETTFAGETMADWLVVMCGPGAMMEAAEDTLIEMGVPASQILSERFDYD
jgi:predicted ferric reductase